MLAWIDLETTGLDPQTEQVLEIACIITNDQFEEVARFERVICSARSFDSLSSVVQDMHAKSGLWTAVKAEGAISESVADAELAWFLHEHAPYAQLAGSTISFDREFMRHHLPAALQQLHYRNLDVSTLNETARRFWPDVYATRPNSAEKAHRAMADIEESLAVARHYTQKLRAA